MPVRPPEINVETKPIANIIGTVNFMLARQMVVSQLNTFIADGTAISNVINVNIEPRKGLMPETNIWCAQTKNERNIIPASELIIA